MPSLEVSQEELDTLATVLQKIGGSPLHSRRKFINSLDNKVMDAGGRILSWAEPEHDLRGSIRFLDWTLDKAVNFDYDGPIELEPLGDALARLEPDLPDYFRS